jgi:hypothetical protein
MIVFSVLEKVASDRHHQDTVAPGCVATKLAAALAGAVWLADAKALGEGECQAADGEYLVDIPMSPERRSPPDLEVDHGQLSC